MNVVRSAGAFLIRMAIGAVLFVAVIIAGSRVVDTDARDWVSFIVWALGIAAASIYLNWGWPKTKS